MIRIYNKAGEYVSFDNIDGCNVSHLCLTGKPVIYANDREYHGILPIATINCWTRNRRFAQNKFWMEMRTCWDSNKVAEYLKKQQ